MLGSRLPTKQDWTEHVYILFIILVVAGSILAWVTYLAIEAGRFQTRVSALKKELTSLNVHLFLLYQQLSEKSQPNGYAPLGNDSIVPDAFLPPGTGNLQPNSGCWNAAANIPPLSDGIGLPNELFIVCVPGSHTLDNQSTWNVYDQLIFNPDLSRWIRVDSGRNTITNEGGDPVGTEQSVIVDGLGPMFTLKKTAASGDVTVSLLSNDTTIEFDMNSGFQPNTTISDEPGGTGESFIAQGDGFDLKLKSFFGEGNVSVTTQGNDIVFNTSNLIPVSSGFTTLDVTLLGGTTSTGTTSFLRMGWHKIGYIIRLSSVTRINTTLTDADRDVTFVLDLSSASDSTISNSSPGLGADNAGGLASGFPFTNEPPLTDQNGCTGYCFSTVAVAQSISCSVAWTNTPGASDGFMNINFEIQYIDLNSL